MVFKTVPITEDTTPIAADTMDLIAFHAALTMLFIASQMPEKKVFMPLHALSQSPVKTPAMKSIRPPSASKTLPTTSAITPATVRNTLPTLSKAAAMYGAIFAINQFIKGTRVCSQISFTASAILPTSSRPLLIAG